MPASKTSPLAAACAAVGLLSAIGPMRQASAAAAPITPPIPTMSGPMTGPGLMYPNPPVSIVPDAVKVEDFPYITEEYLVSGTVKGSLCTEYADLVRADLKTTAVP
jgi:hypothetical protein